MSRPQRPKPPLTASAGEVDYDVTRPQPQLFVASSFARMHDVLDEVVRELPSVQGGEVALAEAVLAQEVATITLAGPAELCGVVSRRVVSDRKTTLFALAGRTRSR